MTLLSCREMELIVLESSLSSPPTLTTPEALEFRAKIDLETAEIRKNGGVVDIPSDEREFDFMPWPKVQSLHPETGGRKPKKPTLAPGKKLTDPPDIRLWGPILKADPNPP